MAVNELGVAGESSRAARAAVADAVRQVAADRLPDLADGLSGVADLLHGSSALRNAVADPSTPAAAKAALLQRVLGDRVSAETISVLQVAATQRWSVTRDLVDTLDTASIDTVLAVAEAAGQLSEIEDELFRFGRILAREPELNLTLTDPALPVEVKRRLLGSLLEGRATATTLRLATRVVTAPRGIPIEQGLANVAQLASARRRQLLAVVSSATVLDDERISSLESALRRLYGRDVHVQVDVDSALVGGLSVRVGDEVVDGSIRHRITQARARFAG
jgi:F-type H+-transporting ATPase subunit delta